MKLFFILIFSSLFVFISCSKCNCEGTTPVVSAQNKKLLPFKRDTIINFISNQADTFKFSVLRSHSITKPKDVSMGFRKSCDCPNDYASTDGYGESVDTINFMIRIDTDKNGGSVHYFFNTIEFLEFDDTTVSRKINNKLRTGLSLKDFSSLSSSSVNQIYYKDSLGLVSVVYKNGTIIDLIK